MKLVTTAAIVAMIVLMMAGNATTSEPSTDLGLHGGFGLTDLRGSDVDVIAGDVGGKFGFMGGVYVRFNFNNRFAFQPELLYVIKGAKRDGMIMDEETGLIRSGVLKTNLSYLEVPLLARISFPTRTKLTPSLFAGPVVSFNQASKTVFDGDVNIEFNIDESIRNIDFGFAVGSTLDYMYGYGSLTAELRYTHGFKSIDAAGPGRDIRNQSISLLVGFKYPLLRTF